MSAARYSPPPLNAIGETVEPGGGIPTGPTILTPTITKETVPGSAPASTKLTNASVNVKLTNATDTNAKGAVTINVYAAPTTTLNTSVDTLLTHVSKSESLKVQKSTTLSIPIKLLPSNLIGGTYHLIVQTVDSAGTASAASTGTFSVAAPFISLAEHVVSLKLPATIVGGAKLKGASVKLTVLNSGNITDDGFTIDLSASPVANDASSTFLEIKKATKISAREVGRRDDLAEEFAGTGSGELLPGRDNDGFQRRHERSQFGQSVCDHRVRG